MAEREYSTASLAIRPFRGKLSAPSNTSHTSSANQNTPREFSQPTRSVKAKKIRKSRRNRKKVLQISLASAMLDALIKKISSHIRKFRGIGCKVIYD